jgi:hypothetical protein
MEGWVKPMANGHERRPCPPHSPILVAAIDEASHTYVARCMTCGLAGPEREDGLEAKLAFDESLEAVR